jgi:hypothetical protein
MKKPTSGYPLTSALHAAGRRHCRPGCSRYSGCGSDSRLLSSWMSTATLASASACTRPWCAQNSSSPPFASSTRTYAWALHRSQTSRAVSGLVGAIAPVNVACLASCLRLLRPSGSCFVPYRSVQHIPRCRRSRLGVVYATSETSPGRSALHSYFPPRIYPPALLGSTHAPPAEAFARGESRILGRDTARHAHGTGGGRLRFVQAPTRPRHLFGDTRS